MSTQKYVLALLIVVLATTSNINFVSGNPFPQGGGGALSKFSDVDITRVPGLGDAAKVAADGKCGADLSEEELMRRHGLGEAAERDFFGPRLINAFEDKDLTKALLCQKSRNKIMKDTCELQAATKRDDTCEIESNKRQIEASIAEANKQCEGVNESLFVTAPEIADPFSQPNKPCIGAPPVLTSKFSEIDITKTRTFTDTITAAENACRADLSLDELKHRVDLAKKTEETFFTVRITEAEADKPLQDVLKCQNNKNKVAKSTCSLEAAKKGDKPFPIEYGELKLARAWLNVYNSCAKVDPAQFVTVP